MKDLLLVVDMQNDFITDALGTPEARDILPRVLEKIRTFSGDVIYTLDTHGENYLDTLEGNSLPVPHCIRGTLGWELQAEVSRLCAQRHALGVEKETFGARELPALLLERYPEGIASVTLLGLCTDICVISNALLLKAFFPQVPILVDSACCAGVTPQSHENALQAMKVCQIQIL